MAFTKSVQTLLRVILALLGRRMNELITLPKWG